jgi:hypothetical protein
MQYDQLPDYLTNDELIFYFKEFLDIALTKQRNTYLLMNELVELADRQWHTYKTLDTEMRQKVDEWIINSLDINNLEMIESAVQSIGRLGLLKSYEFLIQSTPNIRNPDIIKSIEEFIEETRGEIVDPYSSLRK